MEVRPKLFSSVRDQSLQPESMGADRFQAHARPILEARGFCCEVTGLHLKSPNTSPLPGIFRLEWRDPSKEKQRITTGSVRVVEGLTYWARHIDKAIASHQGTLIFAPWLSQGNILSLFRMAMIVKSDEGASEKEAADAILGMFQNLRQAELMLTALGLNGAVESWDPVAWMAGIRDLPAKERKQYVHRFARHVRFLPSVSVYKPIAEHWRQAWGLPEKGKTSQWQAQTLKWYSQLAAANLSQ